ncbi:GNAT family N-acetyltransferase [Ferrovum myxofaciens]|uniref:GNAT family N-acetyltransferase n=1 Tax=Ferrovum myxofaciens TaxID=416213 RepID=UPI002356232D|nr:GNAT family protein [Ferrovum myxofaciens]
MGEAEFRIALRSDKAGQGLGWIVTSETLEKGFDEIGLTRIHLIVRKNNLRAIRLYHRLGFTLRGECHKDVNRKPTHFLMLDLQQNDYLAAMAISKARR